MPVKPVGGVLCALCGEKEELGNDEQEITNLRGEQARVSAATLPPLLACLQAAVVIAGVLG
jgi:hypothetical protein